MKPSVVFLLVAPLACRNPLDVRPSQEFTLALGERAQVQDAGFTLVFESVPSDTRCPLDVVCVSAGNAEVQLVLHFGPPQALTPDRPLILNTTEDPHALPVDGYMVELLALDPQPVAGQAPPMAYRATLRVDALGAFP
jgi:hypothetical protein